MCDFAVCGIWHLTLEAGGSLPHATQIHPSLKEASSGCNQACEALANTKRQDARASGKLLAFWQDQSSKILMLTPSPVHCKYTDT